MKLPGLLGVARHPGEHSGLASDRARRRPSASRHAVLNRFDAAVALLGVVVAGVHDDDIARAGE
ncbi:MAG TPA: hypothetical protein VFW64_04915 [Pseudonocardiaceae bacterium]|nr:hypothetical protein [Pseudonocardiaceae bacterium]